MNTLTSIHVETLAAHPAEHQHVLDALSIGLQSPSMTYSSFSTRTLVGVQPGKSRMSVTENPFRYRRRAAYYLT
jgi:hypothetical protein